MGTPDDYGSIEKGYADVTNKHLGKDELLELFQNNPWLRHVYIGNMSVLPSMQGRGCGARLLHEAIELHNTTTTPYSGQTRMYWGVTYNPHMLKLAGYFDGAGAVPSEDKKLRTYYHRHIGEIGHGNLWQDEIRYFRKHQAHLLHMGEYGSLGTDLMTVDDQLVAVRMQETIDASPRGRFIAPHQEVIIMNPSYQRTDALVRLMGESDAFREIELWTNAFQISDSMFGQRQPIDSSKFPKSHFKQPRLFCIPT